MTSMIDRRTFLVGTGAVLLAAPLAAEGQSTGRLYKIGYLGGTSAVPMQPGMAALRQHLRELGWVDGRNIVFEMRWADGKADRLPTLARELVALGADVIVAQGSPATRAAKQVTTTVPIVMWNTTDPVGQGFVASLAKPGGNVTGLSDFSGELSSKRLELLREAVPRASRVAVVLDPAHPAHMVEWNRTEAAAQTLGMHVYRVEVRTANEIDGAFAKMLQERVPVAILFEGFIFADNIEHILQLATRQRLAIMSAMKDYVLKGGLMYYAPDTLAMWRPTAVFVDKILKGAKPADLPVEQPTKVELVINLKTAKALGLTIPQSLLLRADEVIQ
jgi:putative ABC transport system substrate-binding protein